MAELDKTISVIESWLKQPVLTPPPINELYDALELLKEQANTINTQLGIISLQKQQIEMALCELQVVSNKFR